VNEGALSKWLNRFLFLANITILSGAMYFIFTRGWVAGAGGWTPVELVTTVLAAVALLITVLGIFIALLAIWGYNRITKEAGRRAETATHIYLSKNVQQLVSDQVPRHVAAEIERIQGDSTYGSAAGQEGGEK
jgi:uncharacterized membrane protein